MRSLRRYFLSGLLFMLPIGVTVWFLYYAFTTIDSLSYRFLLLFFHKSVLLEKDKYVFGFSLLVLMLLILGMGWLASNIFGRIFTRLVDKLFESVPVVNKIYHFIKQITKSFSLEGGNVFKQVVLIDYPHPGLKTLGFVANKFPDGLSGDNATKGKLAIFVPTSPTPMSGFVVLVDESDCIPLDMTIEEALRFYVSGGVLTRSS